MTRRKVSPLAYCEYVSPNPDSVQVSRARLELFDATRRVYPLFFERLAEDVFPLYRELAEAGCLFWGINGPPGVSPFEHLTQGSVASSGGHCLDTPATLQKRGVLKSVLSEWAARFNANRLWLMDDAIRILQSWQIAPEWLQSLKWNLGYAHSSLPSTGDSFQFQYPGWETQLFSWARYSQLIRKQFEDELDAYEGRTRKLAESLGLVRARRKYSPQNFDWFALYRFAGLSTTQIAKKNRSENLEDPVSTIRKGIKAAAELMIWGDIRDSRGCTEAENSVAPNLPL